MENETQRPRVACEPVASFEALVARPQFRNALVSFLRPDAFLCLRATDQQFAGTLKVVHGMIVDVPGAKQYRTGPVWVEGNVLTIGAFPDDPRFLGWFLLTDAWIAWKDTHPNEADDARFRPQVHHLNITAIDSREMRLFEAGGAWIAEVLDDAAWQHIRSGTIPDGAIVVRSNDQPYDRVRWTSYPAINAHCHAGTARPVALYAWDPVLLPENLPWVTRFDTHNNECGALNRDFRTCRLLEHIQLGGWTTGSFDNAFHPPPNLRSFVITSCTTRDTADALARAARDTPHLEDLGTFVLNAETRVCDVPPRIKRLRLRLDSAAPLNTGRIRNRFLERGAFFVPPAVEALLVVCNGDRTSPLDFSAVPPVSALRELVVNCEEWDAKIAIAAAPLCIKVLSCPVAPENLAALRHLRVLTLAADIAIAPELCRTGAGIAVEELTLLGEVSVLPLWPRLRVFCAHHWIGKTLTRAKIPPTLEVIDVHCTRSNSSVADENADERDMLFCSRNALPSSLRIFRVTTNSSPAHDRIRKTPPEPCPALVVMTVGVDFSAWHAIPPSVRVLIFTYAVPPSFWTSPIVRQLTGALVWGDPPVGGIVSPTDSSPIVGAPAIAASPRGALGAVGPHMWWRRIAGWSRFAEDCAQMSFEGTFGF